MFKKTLSILFTMGILVSLLSVAGAQSPSEGTTSTSILVQNLSTNTASVRVDFYNTSGNNTGYKEETALGGELSTTFDQRYDSGNPGEDPFQGAAIVSADQPIGAVVQEVRTGGSGGVNSYDSYNGLISVGKSIRAPLLLRNINSAGNIFNTMMSIQNTNLSSQAAVTVTYTAILGNDYVYHGTIPAGGSLYLNQADETNLGDTFFGSALIESDQDIGVVVNSGAQDGSSLIVYPTYTSGASNVYIPGLMKNIPSMGDNYFTSFTIVNMGDSPVTVQIEYVPLSSSYTVGAPYTKVVTDSLTIDQRYDSAITSDTFFGAVNLSVQGSGTIAAMLNERGDDGTTGAAKFATTYSGFTSGVTQVYVPYLLKYITSAGYSWSTSILIQNLDTSSDLTVDIYYNESPLIGTHSYTSTKTVSAFDFVDLRYDTNLGQDTFYGGAKIVSRDNHPFGVVVLVRGSEGSGDALSSYLQITQ